MKEMKENPYEKIPHAVFRLGKQVSRTFSCKADAELELEYFVRDSIYYSSCFKVDKVKTD